MNEHTQVLFFFIAESLYKALQTSELLLLHVLKKSEILTKKKCFKPIARNQKMKAELKS